MNEMTKMCIRKAIENIFEQWAAEELATWETDESADMEMLTEAVTKLQDELNDYISNLDK